MSLLKWVASAASVAAVTLSISVYSSVSVADASTVKLQAYNISLSDGVSVTDESDAHVTPYKIELNDSVTVGDAQDVSLVSLETLEINVNDEITVIDSETLRTAHWIDINSTHYDSDCGDEGSGHTVPAALNGSDYWAHYTTETHWFIVDLGEAYNVTKVAGRSNGGYDPTEVNIYVNDTGSAPWGDAVLTGISTWQNTASAVIINTTPKSGQFVKVEIIDTENVDNYLTFGATSPFSIFNVYGEILPAVHEINLDDSLSITDSQDLHHVGFVYDINLDDTLSLTDYDRVAFQAYNINLSNAISIADYSRTAFQAYHVNLNDGISITDASDAHLTPYKIELSDAVSIVDSRTVQRVSAGPLTIDLNDAITIADDVSIHHIGFVYEINLNDGITISDSQDVDILLLEIDVNDSVTVADDLTIAKKVYWIGINSLHYDSHCGDSGTHTLEEALDGDDYWEHLEDETHWFILNLGQSYLITNVRGRSLMGGTDPIDVNIYVSETNGNWGAAVATGISSWQDTDSWVEESVTPKSGQYIKIEIVDTESFVNWLIWGGNPDHFPIFDAGVEIPTDNWIGISSSYWDSDCGDTGGHTVPKALGGTDYWSHETDHTHWFVADLGRTYSITKVKGRSFSTSDPTDINIYVSETNGNWGSAVKTGITTWQDTEDFVAIDTTPKNGRYVKVEIIDTEHANDYLAFGASEPFTIFDVYGVRVSVINLNDGIRVRDSNTQKIFILKYNQIVELFRFPQVDEIFSPELQSFFRELEQNLNYALTGDFYIGGISHSDESKTGNSLSGDYVETDDLGTVIFHGKAGLLSGCCYGNHIAWPKADMAENIWYPISDTSMLTSHLRGVTHDGKGKLTVVNAGEYEISYHATYQLDAANKHLEWGIMIDDDSTAQDAGRDHSETKFSNQEEHTSGITGLNLAAGSYIQVGVRCTDTGTPDLTVQFLNISMFQIGGVG